MVEDPTLVVPNLGPPRSPRWRRVLGLGLLLLGLGDLLFMNIVLLPQVLAGQTILSLRASVDPDPALARIEPEPRPQAQPTSTAPPEIPAAFGGEAVVDTSPTAPKPPSTTAPPRGLPSFAPLLFESNLSRLSPHAQEALAKLVTLLRTDPKLRVRLEGHTDDFGPERFNLLLSRMRAQNVRTWLANLGIDQNRIDINAHGSEQPAHAGHTPKARAQNRRVEIFLN